MRKRRLARVTTLAAGVALAAGIPLTVLAQAPDQTIDPQDRGGVAAARYEAALQAERLEQDRLDAAAASYEDERAESGSVPREYLVSLTEPVAVEDLLAASDAVGGIELTELHTWLRAPGSLFPIVGVHDPSRLEADEAEAQAGALRRNALTYLDRRKRGLERAAEARGGDAAQTYGAQRSEAAQIEAALRQNGVEVYGFRCVCSPDALDALDDDVRGLEYRAVESQTAGDEQRFDLPVWPADPLRDRVIDTKGHYGRS